MSDGGRPPDGAGWPPPVPSGIHLRSRTAVAPQGTLAPAAPASLPEPSWGHAPAEAAPPTVAEPGPTTANAPEPPSATDPLPRRTAPPRPPADTPGPAGPLLDPAGYRLRLIRDAAAALALLAGVVLVGSLLARPAPTGDVLSATGAPPSPAASPGPTLSPSPTADTSAPSEQTP